MIKIDAKKKESAKTIRGVGRTVFDDLRRSDFRTVLHRDLRDLYRFYIDEERRARLERMGRVRRSILIFIWILKSMILKLTPVRRILLIVCFIFFLSGSISFQMGRLDFTLHLGAFSFIILMIILMLELKDKLLAHDELIIGRAVQRALLPEKNPAFPGWEIWLYTRAANDVGGDLVDYLKMGNDRLGIMLGDVAGKGLGAALLMAKLQATLRALAPDCKSLSELGSRMNEILYRDGIPNRFATLVYLEMKPDSGHLRFLNAGHMPIIVLEGSKIEKIDPASSLLGAFPGSTFVEQSIELGPGNSMLIYSDGLTEACNDRGEFFNEERLLHLCSQCKGLSVDETGKSLLYEVEQFVGNEPQSDDISLVILRRAE